MTTKEVMHGGSQPVTIKVQNYIRYKPNGLSRRLFEGFNGITK